jgi:heme oxygenase
LPAERGNLNVERLRQETAADHAAVEGTVPLMIEELDVDFYVSCLRRIHGIVAAWEEFAAANTPEGMSEMVSARQRQKLLEQDLASFGAIELNADRPAIMVPNNAPSFLGAMYVMEGSALGGKFIARHVERVLGLVDGQGSAYFRGHNERTSAMWEEFCEILRTQVPEDETEAVVSSAKAMFATFGAWMQPEAKAHLSEERTHLI